MKLLNKLPSLLVILSLTFFIGCQQQHDIDKLKSEINIINDELTKAMLANDSDAALKFYTQDAISLPSYQPMIRGMEDLKADADKQKQMPLNMKSFSLTSTDVWVSGKFVVEIGTYNLIMEMPEMPGGEMKDKGKYLTVFEIQDDGSLLMKAETWNTDTNPWEEIMKHQMTAEGMENK